MDNANTAPVVYVLRVLDYDLLNDQSREDLGDEILCSGSVYRSLERAKWAAEEDAKNSAAELNEGNTDPEDNVELSGFNWAPEPYTDYADVERMAYVLNVSELTTLYRVIEVELHD